MSSLILKILALLYLGDFIVCAKKRIGSEAAHVTTRKEDQKREASCHKTFTMNKMINSIPLLFLISTTFLWPAASVTLEEEHVWRILKKSGGTSGGSKIKTNGSSNNRGGSSGGGKSGSTAPKDGNYMSGGLGNQYRTSGSQQPKASGSCCTYLCCSSGFRPGYRRYWYRGYRPTQQEGETFEGSLQNASMALDDLALLNETAVLYTGECALLLEETLSTDDLPGSGILVNRSTASESALGNFTNVTIRAHLTDLSDRLSFFEWIQEADLRIDIRAWFLDYNALQPCLDDLSELSIEHETRVLEVRQEVEDAEDIANAWEQRLASASGNRVWKGFAALTTLSMAFALVM